MQEVAAKVLPSTVSVLASSAQSGGEGSGIILTADGLILTNNHVVAGATDLEVRFNDGTTATAKVVGTTATDDLAVIKADGVSGLTPAVLGSSADLQVGQPVVAIGSPLGLSATVTSGIVSALNRPVRTSGEATASGQSQDTVINAVQTDAAINPGNSGGALVDMNGAVIGINSAIASLSQSTDGSQPGSIGVGFAIPIDQAKRIAQEIIDTGKATHAVLGASVGDAADATSQIPTGAKIAEHRRRWRRRGRRPAGRRRDHRDRQPDGGERGRADRRGPVVHPERDHPGHLRPGRPEPDRHRHPGVGDRELTNSTTSTTDEQAGDRQVTGAVAVGRLPCGPSCRYRGTCRRVAGVRPR